MIDVFEIVCYNTLVWVQNAPKQDILKEEHCETGHF